MYRGRLRGSPLTEAISVHPHSPRVTRPSLGRDSAEYSVTEYISQQLSRFIHHSPITHIVPIFIWIQSVVRIPSVGCRRPTSDSAAFCRLYHA